MAHGIPAQPGRYFDSWDEAEAASKVHAQLSEANAYDGGDAELGEAGTHYERASAARAAAAVREPLAAPDAPGGSSPGGRVDPDVRAEALDDDGTQLFEANIYEELLHPCDRLGHWIEKRGYKVRFEHASEPSASTSGKTITVAGPDADRQYEALLTHADGLVGTHSDGSRILLDYRQGQEGGPED
jgi:hypothetical protein